MSFRTYHFMPQSEVIAGEWLEQFQEYADGVRLISDMLASSLLTDETTAPPVLDMCQRITMLRFLRTVSTLVGEDIDNVICGYIELQAKKNGGKK